MILDISSSPLTRQLALLTPMKRRDFGGDFAREAYVYVLLLSLCIY